MDSDSSIGGGAWKATVRRTIRLRCSVEFGRPDPFFAQEARLASDRTTAWRPQAAHLQILRHLTFMTVCAAKMAGGNSALCTWLDRYLARLVFLPCSLLLVASAVETLAKQQSFTPCVAESWKLNVMNLFVIIISAGNLG